MTVVNSTADLAQFAASAKKYAGRVVLQFSTCKVLIEALLYCL